MNLLWWVEYRPRSLHRHSDLLVAGRVDVGGHIGISARRMPSQPGHDLAESICRKPSSLCLDRRPYTRSTDRILVGLPRPRFAYPTPWFDGCHAWVWGRHPRSLGPSSSVFEFPRSLRPIVMMRGDLRLPSGRDTTMLKPLSSASATERDRATTSCGSC